MKGQRSDLPGVLLLGGPQAHPILLTPISAQGGPRCRQQLGTRATFPDTTCSLCPAQHSPGCLGMTPL